MKYVLRLLFLWSFVICQWCSLTGQYQASFDLRWELSTNPNRGQSTVVDKLDRPYFYFANKEGGLQIFEYDLTGIPEEIRQFPVDSFSGHDVMNAYQHETFLYLALGDFFSSEPKQAGMAVIDVSNPGQPKLLGQWYSTEPMNGTNYIYSNGEVAYLGAMNFGLVIFDVSNKNEIDSVNTLLPDTHFPVQNPTGTIIPNTRGFQVVNDTMWLCFDAGGLRVLDLQNPMQPIEISQYINPLQDITQQAYNDIVIHGDVAYISLDYCGFEILDISNPVDIKQLGSDNPWGCEDGGWLFNEGHANQLQLDTAHQLLFLSAGDSEIVCYDVNQPTVPVMAGAIGLTGDSRGSWGVTLHQDQLFVSYISTFVPFVSLWSGIQIFKIQIDSSNVSVITPENLTEVSVFPNPFSNTICIHLNHPKQVQTASLFSLTGVQVASWDIHEYTSTAVIKTQLIKSGLYILQIETDKGIFVQKIIKQ
jgi:hypothetical protein